MATTKKATAAKTAKKDETAEMAAAAKAAAQAKKAVKTEAETKTTTTAAATTAEAPAVVKEKKKAPAKKAPAKKTAPKKVAPKKPAAVKAATSVEAPAETKVDFFVEFAGVQVSIDEVVKNVKATYGKDAKEISVYLKPEESKAYFVADGEEKEMDVFFC